jgi:cysteinyl-tRNA synthetase
VPHVPGLPEIGQRASIRLFEPEGGFRDLLGILESPTTIRKKDGSLITFDPDRIFLWKVVPPK